MTYVRMLAGDTDAGPDGPAIGQPQPPISPLVIGAHGGWRELRQSPQDGACGVTGYPCEHPGVDVAGAQGTTVVAPEDGTVVMVADGNSAPFVGYGPWLAIVRGVSGKFHLLGHLDPAAAALAPMGAQVVAGQPIGVTSSANHTHWEVRSKMIPDFAAGESNFSNNTDPLGWLGAAALGIGAVLIVAGAVTVFWLLRRRS